MATDKALLDIKVDRIGNCARNSVMLQTSTADIEEAAHGRWEDVREDSFYVPDMHFTMTKTTETCSQCKARIGFVGPKQYLFDAFCPSCGKKMYGGADNGV